MVAVLSPSLPVLLFKTKKWKVQKGKQKTCNGKDEWIFIVYLRRRGRKGNNNNTRLSEEEWYRFATMQETDYLKEDAEAVARTRKARYHTIPSQQVFSIAKAYKQPDLTWVKELRKGDLESIYEQDVRGQEDPESFDSWLQENCHFVSALMDYHGMQKFMDFEQQRATGYTSDEALYAMSTVAWACSEWRIKAKWERDDVSALRRTVGRMRDKDNKAAIAAWCKKHDEAMEQPLH